MRLVGVAAATIDLEPWHDFFVASAGACAALAGLVFVAVSINIEAILKLPGVADRALQSVLLLVTAVVVSLFALIPQHPTWFGYEVLGVGLLLTAGFVATYSRVVHTRSGRLNPLGCLFYIVAGVLIIAGSDVGLGWVVAGIIAGTVGGVINAWVLLVEILR